MQLSSYAGKQEVRLDLLLLKLDENISKIFEQVQLTDENSKKSVFGIEGLCLGVHLTNGIYHQIEIKNS